MNFFSSIRFRNAFCAFIHGHTPRDLQRVRQRRLQLLSERLIALKQKQIDKDEFGFLAAFEQPRLDAMQCNLHRAVNHADSLARRALIQNLTIARFQLHRQRFDEFVEVSMSHQLQQPHIHYIESMLVPPPKGYGKLYESLEEDFIFDFLIRKLRFYWRYRHFYFTPVKRLWGRLVHKGAGASP